MRLAELPSGDPDLPLFRVDNGTVALTFLPSVGGRLLSIVVAGRELLWRDLTVIDERFRAVRPRASWPVLDGTFASWTNVGGSKTWPAPQGWGGEDQWAGPPDGVLDSGAWSIAAVEQDSQLQVTMVSADDPRTGLRITRDFVVPAVGGAFSQRITFTNTSDRTVTWSLWEVCQVLVSASPDAAVTVDSADDRTVDLGAYHGRLVTEWGDGVLRVPVQDVVAKLGFPSALGRIAYRSTTGGVQLTFSPDPAGRYPDGDSRAELWMQSPLDEPIAELSGLHPRERLAELEVLSPLHELPPGASESMGVGWSVA